MFFDANVQGTDNMLAAVEESTDLKRFVHVSTTDVHGYSTVPCPESHPLMDVGLGYNHTKISSEKAMWAAYGERGLPVTIVRPANASRLAENPKVWDRINSKYCPELGKHL
jgi:nucleoside-diphosphate-sugar epimerase